MSSNARANRAVIVKDAADADFVGKEIVLKAIDTTKRTADFVASSETIDAHEEIVDQASWHLEDYQKNPVVLYAHMSRDLPIGRCVSVGVVNNRLECKIEFATEEMNPLAEQVWKMVQGKFLNAVSVGFVPRNYRYELRDGRDVWVWSDCILKEISVTPVPANPDALAKMKSKARGVVDGEPKQETNMLFKTIEEAIAAFSKSEAEKNLAEKQLTEAKASASTAEKAYEGTITTLTKDRDDWKVRAETAEKSVGDLQAKTFEQEVDALVGVKITPAEKDTFVELRKSNEALFTKMIAQRPEMKHLGGQVIKDDKAGEKKDTTTEGTSTNGADLSNAIFTG